MKKSLVRITESDLHRIIKESVHRLISESSFIDRLEAMRSLPLEARPNGGVGYSDEDLDMLLGSVKKNNARQAYEAEMAERMMQQARSRNMENSNIHDDSKGRDAYLKGYYG